jgi:1-acyl-sn-glycerol-3-phosphate acyltransferase
VTGDLWRPRSDCGPGCLPSPVGCPAAPTLRRLLRLLRLVGVVLGAALALPALALAGPAARRRALRRFAGRVLHALDVHVAVRGALGQHRALLVANHVSWLDTLVLLAGAQPPGPGHAANLRLVAKAEVRGWPVVGRFAALVGTVFIDRARPRRLPATVAEVRAALSRGDRVAVFPEGTTSCGRALVAFRPAMFQAAIEAGARVIPVRLRYRLPDGAATTAAAFIGDETLLESLRRILALPGVRVDVHACAALHPDVSASRRALAHLAGAAVGAHWPAAAPAAPAAATEYLPGALPAAA